MMLMLFIFIFICSFEFIIGLEVVPERPEINYYNKKYLNYIRLSIRRHSRHSPHYIDLDLETKAGCGNNVTIDMALLEYLSSGYQPTPVQAQYKLCDFLMKEPFLGQMFAKQLVGNWTCPFPAGEYHFNNLVIHLEDFPFNIPFAFSSVSAQTRVDVQVLMSTTKEAIFKFKTYVKVIQKPKKYIVKKLGLKKS